MNKTVTITINGTLFHIEEDAFEKLSAYLDSIRERYGKEDGGGDILSDIESSIAEKFKGKTNKNKQTITKKDVEDLIKIMGTVEDFDEEVGDLCHGEEVEEKKGREQKKEETKTKKLYRNPEDVIIAGVCSGLAEYFGVDPVLVRLIFAASVFAGGAGIWVYLVLWLVMPMAKTSTQRLEMKGAPITLKKLEKAAKELKKKGQQGGSALRKTATVPIKFLGELMHGLKNFFLRFGSIISVIVGVLIIFSMVVAIMGVSFVGAVMIFNIDSPYISQEIPIKEVAGGASYIVGVVSLYAVILVPLLFVMLLGLLFAKRKNVFSTSLNIILVVVWMIAIVALGVTAIDIAPKIEKAVREYEETNNVVKEFKFKDFDQVAVLDTYNVNIKKGDEYLIKAEGRESALDQMQVNNEDGKLAIRRQDAQTKFCVFCYHKPLQIDVIMPKLEGLEMGDYSDVNVEGFEGGVLNMDLAQGAEVKVKSGFEKVIARLKLYSKAEFLISPIELEAELSESSRLRVEDNKLVNTKLDLRSYSRVELLGEPSENILASSSLAATLKGSSRVNIEELNIENINISLDDYSRAMFDGRANILEAELDNSSKLEAYEIEVDDAILKLDSYSIAEINAQDSLDITARGTSNVYYEGEPKIESSVSSSSGLNLRDD